MIIYLGQSFNSSLPIPPFSKLGSIYLNYAGFLSILNTQLGLITLDISQNKRAVQYLNCLHKKNTIHRFYHQSLLVDDLAVAKELLAWRDDLYLAGWQGEFSGESVSQRLTDFSDVEILASKQVADNKAQSIQHILHALEKYKTQIVKIQLYDDLAILSHQWKLVLHKLKTQGVAVIEAPSLNFHAENNNDLQALQQRLFEFNQNKENDKLEKLVLSGDSSVLLIEAQSRMLSAELLSHYLFNKQNLSSSIILAESNGEIVDQNLVMNNFARQGFSQQAHFRSIVQLLPLSLSLMWQPVAIDKILSFLVHPVNMLPGFVCRLLVHTISSYPGTGGDLVHRPLSPKKRWWNLTNGKCLGKKTMESYSSLDSLINSPYQWVLNDKAQLKKSDLLSIAEGNQLKGTLVHRLFEIFFTQNKNQWATLPTSIIAQWFNEHFDHLIQCEAATLLGSGKKRELDEFKETAHQALIGLLDHLKLANIKTVKMEVCNEASFFAGSIKGYIDMLLTNEQGDEIVLDLKWGWEKGRLASLEKNMHVQLAIYAYLRKQKTKAKQWPEQAFYIIQSGHILAQNNFIFPHAHVCSPGEGENVAKLWKRLEKSYHWRRQQLDKGQIEMTIQGTEPDELDSIPPMDALPINESNDDFNDFETLMGWCDLR